MRLAIRKLRNSSHTPRQFLRRSLVCAHCDTDRMHRGVGTDDDGHSRRADWFISMGAGKPANELATGAAHQLWRENGRNRYADEQPLWGHAMRLPRIR